MIGKKHQNYKRSLIALLVLGLYIALCCFLLSPKEKTYFRDLNNVHSQEELSVLSYNIQARPVLDACDQKTPLIGERLNSYDLIGLQEAFSSYDKIFQRASSLEGVAFCRRRHPLKLVNSGLAVLTRFPISDIDSEYFEEEGALENCLGSKGVLMARIRVNGCDLDFYTTHLAAGEGQKLLPSKRLQLEQIISFIRKHSPKKRAVILSGDFNLRLEDLGALEVLGLVNTAVELNLQKDSFIDHIFYRSGKDLLLKPISRQVLRQGFDSPEGTPLSDHHPLLVQFEVKRKRSK